MTDTTAAPVASSASTPANANASPKKKTTKAPKAKSSHVSSHPKYSEMIKTALKALNERSGSSRAAILKFVLANYSLDPAQANQHLKLALKNGVKSKLLKQTKGNGASGSFKLAAKTESTATKKKTSKPKKTTTTTTSSTGAHASATKKRPRSKSAGSKPAKKVATPANVNNSATADASAAKPKKVQAPKAAKPRSSATPKSANAAKATKKAKPSMSIDVHRDQQQNEIISSFL